MSEGFAPQEGAGPAGFRPDARFTAPGDGPPPPEPEDPVALARAEGFAAGRDAALAEAESDKAANCSARDSLTLEFRKLDAALAEELREHLRMIVAKLCETALAPMALDEAALIARIERAVAMLARAGDERTIRLHPDDLALVSPHLAKHWQVEPDPSLARGALRVETPAGGVEDGPEQWVSAIAAALNPC